MPMPAQPKIYHIVHVDRLASIANDGCLWADSEVQKRQPPGTTIGMSDIKLRRLTELTLNNHPGLHVGECVPFYFCPRSVMLFLLHKGNTPGLTYGGGQEQIVHLEADLHAVVDWAKDQQRRWAFTLSNAGARYFEDKADLADLHKLEWDAISAQSWKHCKEGKQAEFLIERSFPWELVERVGVLTDSTYRGVLQVLPPNAHRPRVEMKQDWYY